MTLFADASAVVKRFVDEASSPEVRDAAGPYVVSALAVRSADPDCTQILVFDHRLAEAAATEGFEVQSLQIE